MAPKGHSVTMDDGGSIDDGDGTVADPLVGSMSGRLLVATPQLRDPRFARAVVLLLDHDESGTVGVVLNQPLDLAVSAEFPSWGQCSALAAPEVFFSGGPVEIDGALVIAALRPGVVAPVVRVVPGSIAVIDIDSEPAEAPYWASGLRVFAGYSGGGPGQLLAELDEGSWYVVDSRPEDLLDPHPEGLWRSVLRRQTGDVALVSTWTDDPDLN